MDFQFILRYFFKFYKISRITIKKFKKFRDKSQKNLV